MADAATNEPRITGSVPLYKSVEPLNRQKHATYGVNNVKEPFGFLRDWHFVPAIAAEFGVASGSFPIVFLGDKKMPVLVMGLRQGSNLFITEDGQFEADHYVPAYVRRYPFVSASNPGDQPSTVCVDVDAEFVVDKDPQQPFFDDKGEPTEYTKQAVDFVSAFERDAQITEAFVQRLVALDLLEKKEIKVANPQDPENPVTVADYFGVSVEKLQALPDDKVLEMHKNNDLSVIHAHLASLQRWERIMRRVAVKANEEQAAQG